MLNKIRLLGKAGKILKAARDDSQGVISASKPLAKKALGKISASAISLGEKGKKIAESLSEDSQEDKKDRA